jgi:23S rRNA (pseudouridine1915-N3)-methyltransferase
MRIVIAAIGKSRNEPEALLCDDYLTRARKAAAPLGISKIALSVADVSRAAETAARLRDEAQKLSGIIPAGSHLVVLDERGKSYPSTDFAAHLGRLRDGGVRDLVFAIGGPDGIDDIFRAGAQERLAFGVQTWPHLLVRALLAEQIYRAMAILLGHPYHRGNPGEKQR